MEKYGKREFNEKEEKLLFDLIKKNNNNKFYSDIYSSLQILINEIIKENYQLEAPISKIIINLPNFILINEELKNFFYDNYKLDKKLFTVDCLISIFEIFEALNWEIIKKNILMDYMIEIEEENKIKILKYFDENKDKKKLINKSIFTSALRKFISRYFAVTREDIYIKSENKLILYLQRSDIWNKNIVDDDDFYNELLTILPGEIQVGNAYDLYNILEGDCLLKKNIDGKIFGIISNF